MNHDPYRRQTGAYDNYAELSRRKAARQARRRPAGRDVLLDIALIALYLALVAVVLSLVALAGAV